MATSGDIAFPASRGARLALLVTTGISILGLTIYVVRLPALLSPLTDSVATSLGQIGLVFAAASLTGALGLTRLMSRMPLTLACALMSGATAMALLVLTVLDAHRSITGLLVFQFPFGLVLGSSASLLPVVITDAYPTSMRSHAAVALASVGGLATVVGGLGADMLLRDVDGGVVILIASACALPLMAILLFGTAGAAPRNPTVPGTGSVTRTLTVGNFRGFLLLSVLTALLIQPVRNLAAPLCEGICATAPADTGKFVAAIAGGVALTGLVTRLLRGNLPHQGIIFGATAVTFMLLGAGGGDPVSSELTVRTMGLLLAVGLLLGLAQSIVLEGVQRVGNTHQRVTAVAITTACTTAVAAVASWVWGVGFDTIGVAPSLMIAAGALATMAVAFSRPRRRKASRATGARRIPGRSMRPITTRHETPRLVAA